MKYGEVMKPLNIQQLEIDGFLKQDPAILKFIDILDRTMRAERVSHFESWTLDERRVHDSGDWKEFSRLRGYTDLEIADFENYLVQFHSLLTKHGEAALCHIVYAHQMQTGILGEDPRDLLEVQTKRRSTHP
jgi:hypothetical protein